MQAAIFLRDKPELDVSCRPHGDHDICTFGIHSDRDWLAVHAESIEQIEQVGLEIAAKARAIINEKARQKSQDAVAATSEAMPVGMPLAEMSSVGGSDEDAA